MGYLARHLPQKETPQTLLPKAQSAIVIAVSYLPHPQPTTNSETQERLQRLGVARYAQGEDYHDWLKEKLQQIILQLQTCFPEEHFLAATDSSPVLERDLAYHAGIGWFVKNTCIIHQQKGSFYLLGEILTTLSCDQVTLPHPDRCGTCNRCIEACPTQAIVSAHVLDARKCISYLTIEAKDVPSLELREQIGAHFFGCDICQDVCPWNGKVLNAEKSEPVDVSEDLKWILTRTNQEL